MSAATGLAADGYLPAAAGRGPDELVRQALRAHGLARLRPMEEESFVELAGRLGEVGLRTDLVIDPVQAAAEQRRRSAAAETRPIVYSPGELEFHTDRPTVDVIGWYCVEQDSRDGAFLLVDTADLDEHFSAAEMKRLGKIEVGYFLRDRETGKEQFGRAPLVSGRPRARRLYYSPWLVQEDSLAESGESGDGDGDGGGGGGQRGRDGGSARLLLARFAAYVAAKRETSIVRIRLEPGEALFVDNHRLLHARGSLPPDSHRHIVRLYITLGSAADLE